MPLLRINKRLQQAGFEGPYILDGEGIAGKMSMNAVTRPGRSGRWIYLKRIELCAT